MRAFLNINNIKGIEKHPVWFTHPRSFALEVVDAVCSEVGPHGDQASGALLRLSLTSSLSLASAAGPTHRC